jgi:polyisoprenoid-binding protein YceI
MLKRLTAAVVLVLVGSVFVQAETWNIDPVHSSVGFSVRHMVLAKVRGNFSDFSGTVTFDGKDISTGSVELTVQTASVDTDNEDRDKHLKSDDFFNVEKFPTMIFKSKNVAAGENGKFTLTGDLTIRETTKEVTFDCEFFGVVNDPWGNTRAGFSASTTINRQEFGLKFNALLETGGLVVANDIDITLDLEMTKVKAETKE